MLSKLLSCFSSAVLSILTADQNLIHQSSSAILTSLKRKLIYYKQEIRHSFKKKSKFLIQLLLKKLGYLAKNYLFYSSFAVLKTLQKFELMMKW